MLATGESLHIRVFDKPDISLAAQANSAGHYAWKDRFADRSPEEIAKVFDIEDPHHVFKQMQRAAKIGRFAGVEAIAFDGESAACVGTMWGADDVSGNFIERKVKQIQGRQPYAWIAQANVRPGYQDQQIGTVMTDVLLSRFDDGQRTTAYVYDENQATLGFFRHYLGYEPTPDYPTEQYAFGEDARPTQQWRLEAGVGEVRERIAMLHPEVHGDLVDGFEQARVAN